MTVGFCTDDARSYTCSWICVVLTTASKGSSLRYLPFERLDAVLSLLRSCGWVLRHVKIGALIVAQPVVVL